MIKFVVQLSMPKSTLVVCVCVCACMCVSKRVCMHAIDEQLMVMKVNQLYLVCLCVTNLIDPVTTNLNLHMYMYSVLAGGQSHGRSTREVS